MKKCLIILFILITLSIFPIESRRLKRVGGKSVVKPEVESVVKPPDVEKREEEVRAEANEEVESVVKPSDVEKREEEDVEVREDEAEVEEGEEVLSEDEVDVESLPDADVNILVPLKEFRDLMGDEIEEAREALAVQALSVCTSGNVKDVLLASSTYTATVFDVLDHSWHRIKYFRSKMKESKLTPEVLDEIAILAGGSGGRRELSTMSDLELMAVVPKPSYDKLIPLFIAEAGKVKIHIDTVNKPMRKFKGSIASSVEELVYNVFLSKGNSMSEVLVSMLLEASVVAGKHEVQDKLKREIHRLMRTPIEEVDSKPFQRFLSTFMKSSSGLVDPKKPFYFGDFIQWKMENWKLRNAVANMEVLKEIASGKRSEFNIKKHLYRGLQTSIQLLSYYTLSMEMKTAGGSAPKTVSGGGPSSTKGAAAAGPSTKGEDVEEEDEGLITPKRKVRGIVASKTLETLAFCARVEGFEKCTGCDELQTVVALRIAAHNYYSAENDNVKLPSLSSRAEVLSRESSRSSVEEEEEVGMMGAEKAPYTIPMLMLPHVYDAIVVSGALQETWIEISNTLQKVLNDRDDFITVLSSEFEKKLEVWKRYVPGE